MGKSKPRRLPEQGNKKGDFEWVEMGFLCGCTFGTSASHFFINTASCAGWSLEYSQLLPSYVCKHRMTDCGGIVVFSAFSDTPKMQSLESSVCSFGKLWIAGDFDDVIKVVVKDAKKKSKKPKE